MIVLRPMHPDEYPAFRQYFIEDYSQEIAQNYGHSIEYSLELAKEDLHRYFPNGPESKKHSLLCIDAEEEGETRLAGYLWHSVNKEEHSSFIFDFYIFSEYRGKGLGTQAYNALERQLEEKGIHQIKLRVAFHNNRALQLYKTLGFMITGYNMSKSIGK